jgi:acyl carrier protein
LGLTFKGSDTVCKRGLQTTLRHTRHKTFQCELSNLNGKNNHIWTIAPKMGTVYTQLTRFKHSTRRKIMDSKEKIKSYIAQNILFSKNGFEYDDDDSFLEKGIVDSMSVMELIMFIEEDYGLTVDDEEMTTDNFDSINRLANYVQRKQAVIA